MKKETNNVTGEMLEAATKWWEFVLWYGLTAIIFCIGLILGGVFFK